MAITHLRKWYTTIIADKSANDQSQVPKVVTITIYKQGATVSGAFTVPVAGTAVTVRGTGRLAAGDDITIGTAPTPTLRVSSVDSTTQVTLMSTTGSDVNVVEGDRLVPVTNLPTIYLDTAGSTTTPNPTVTDSQGYIECYLSERYFDYKASATGITSQLYTDEQCGPHTPGWVNVTEYATFQEAVDALPVGGTLFIPSGLYDRTTVPQLTPMNITKTIHIKGDHATRDTNTQGTRLVYKNYATEDLTSTLITITGDTTNFTTIEDIYFEGPGAAGTGCCIALRYSSYGTMRNCAFQTWPSYALTGDTGTFGDNVGWTFESCRFQGSYSNAIVGLGVVGRSTFFQTLFLQCSFNSSANAPHCMEIVAAPATTLLNCTLETFQNVSSTNGDTGAVLYINGAAPNGLNKIRVEDCWFETNQAANISNNWFIYLKGPVNNCHITGNIFNRPQVTGPNASLRGIKIEDTTGHGCHNFYIANNIGDLAGATSNGADDILIPSTDGTRLTYMNNSVKDGVRFDNNWTISGENERNTTRLFGSRIKTTAAKPSAGDWLAGQMIYNTNDHYLYICDVAGGPGTWYRVLLAVAP